MSHYINRDGVLDLDFIRREATLLAAMMATHADAPEHLDRIADAVVERVGLVAYPHVLASAARTLAEHVLAPLLKVSDQCRERHGFPPRDLREDLAEMLAEALADAEGGGDQ